MAVVEEPIPGEQHARLMRVFHDQDAQRCGRIHRDALERAILAADVAVGGQRLGTQETAQLSGVLGEMADEVTGQVYYQELVDWLCAPPQAQALEVLADQRRRRLLNRAHSLYARNDLEGAQRAYGEAAEAARQAFGTDHIRYVDLLQQQGTLAAERGDNLRAVELLRQAADTNRRIVGPKSSRYCSSLNALAQHHASLGRFADAEALYREALEITRELYGEGHEGYAIQLGCLESLYPANGDGRASQMRAFREQEQSLPKPTSEPVAFAPLAQLIGH